MGNTEIEPIEHRVIRLELKVDDHDEELVELRASSKALSAAMHGIEKTLHQIKWIAVGAALVLFLKELGIAEGIKIILGGV